MLPEGGTTRVVPLNRVVFWSLRLSRCDSSWQKHLWTPCGSPVVRGETGHRGTPNRRNQRRRLNLSTIITIFLVQFQGERASNNQATIYEGKKASLECLLTRE